MDSSFRRNSGEHTLVSARVTRFTILRPPDSIVSGHSVPDSDCERPDLSGDWFKKTHLGRQEKARYETISRLPDETRQIGSVIAHTAKGQTRTRPRNYELGMVVRIPYITPSLKRSADLQQAHAAWSIAVGPITAKLRPSIIVGISSSCLTCIPMQTSHGRGPNEVDADDCIWIRHVNDPSTVWANVPPSEYLMLSEQTKRWEDNAYVNVNRICQAQYRYPILRLGQLTATSFERLKRMWLANNEQGLLSLDQQKTIREISAENMATDATETDEFSAMRTAQAQARIQAQAQGQAQGPQPAAPQQQQQQAATQNDQPAAIPAAVPATAIAQVPETTAPPQGDSHERPGGQSTQQRGLDDQSAQPESSHEARVSPPVSPNGPWTIQQTRRSRRAQRTQQRQSGQQPQRNPRPRRNQQSQATRRSQRNQQSQSSGQQPWLTQPWRNR